MINERNRRIRLGIRLNKVILQRTIHFRGLSGSEKRCRIEGRLQWPAGFHERGDKARQGACLSTMDRRSSHRRIGADADEES
jgi:hypothetical protein